MANVFGGKINDRETGGLKASYGEEQTALAQLKARNGMSRGREIKGHKSIRRAVDGVVYSQKYLDVTEENLRMVLGEVVSANLQPPAEVQGEITRVQAILDSGDRAEIRALVQSIQQIRLFLAPDKDLTKEDVQTHPLTIDIKFKANEGDDLTREAIKWRAIENGDQAILKAVAAIEQRYEESGQQLGHLRRHIIAYEWLPESVVQEIQAELDIDEVTTDVRDAIAEQFAVKLDVRYDLITTPDGREVRVVSREAEIDGDDDQADYHLGQIQQALSEEGYATFIPEEFDFGTLALSKNPVNMIRRVTRKHVMRKVGSAVKSLFTLNFRGVGESIREIGNIVAGRSQEAMDEQVDEVMETFDGRQIVVDLPNKKAVIDQLTTAGDIEKVRSALEQRLNKAIRPVAALAA